MLRTYTLGMSLDLNTVNTGMVLWKDGMFDQSFDIKPVAEPAAMHNWLRMSIAIWRVILVFEPDWIAAEGIYAGRNAKTNDVLSRLFGAVQTYAVFRLIPFFDISTAYIDKACGIDHRQDRKQQTLTLAKLELENPSQDVADAYAAGIAGRGKYMEYKLGRSKLTKT